jgi:hypothetical protein
MPSSPPPCRPKAPPRQHPLGHPSHARVATRSVLRPRPPAPGQDAAAGPPRSSRHPPPGRPWPHSHCRLEGVVSGPLLGAQRLSPRVLCLWAPRLPRQHPLGHPRPHPSRPPRALRLTLHQRHLPMAPRWQQGSLSSRSPSPPNAFGTRVCPRPFAMYAPSCRNAYIGDSWYSIATSLHAWPTAQRVAYRQASARWRRCELQCPATYVGMWGVRGLLAGTSAAA